MFENAILERDCLHSFNHCKISVMQFSPIFNKTSLKFPMPWVWIMFPKSWKKYLWGYKMRRYWPFNPFAGSKYSSVCSTNWMAQIAI
jgi:hypothetical protein